MNPALRNPAILSATLGQHRNGSEEVLTDALISGDPSGAILRQEARGQRDLCAKGQIPRDGATEILGQLETLGFVLTESSDELFYNAKLPAGWSIKATNHSMHSDLLDGQGRKRGGIFYKAAFYDRKANFHLKRRFAYGMRPVGGWDNYPSTHREAYITDCDADLWVNPEKVADALNVVREDRSEYDRLRAIATQMEAEARARLETQFPAWQDPLAYWD